MLVDRLQQRSPALVMGVVNVTPDSFSDGGQFNETAQAIEHALALQAAGADILDIGGESTRPGAGPVSLQEELDRVIPVIEQVAAQSDAWISIDTSKAQVMRAAVAAGAHMINDVRALQGEGALEAAAALNVPVCLMHMQGTPQSMQQAPDYASVCAEVGEYLQSRAAVAISAGIGATQIVIDPGFGFGKTLAHNLALFRDLHALTELGYPLLVGVSRKSMLGEMTGRGVEDRLAGSLALAMLAAQQGAAIIRVHDVAPTVDVLKVLGHIHSSHEINREY